MKGRLEDWIRVYERSFTSDFCDRCIAHVDRGDKTTRFDFDWRRGSAYPLNQDTDLLTEFIGGVTALIERYKAETGAMSLTVTHLESPNVFKYAVTPRGEPKHHFAPHTDSWNETSATRQLSVITYLNDVAVGGATSFPDIGKKIAPRKGRTLLFPSSFLFTHAGEAPISEHKYIVVSWLHLGQKHLCPTYPL